MVMVVASHAWQLPLTSVKDDGDNDEDPWDWILCRRPTCSTSLHFSCLSTLSLPRSLLPDSYPPLFSYFLPPPKTCHCDIIRSTAEILILKKHISILTTKFRMLPDVFTTLRWVHLSNLPRCGLSSTFHHSFMGETGIRVQGYNASAPQDRVSPQRCYGVLKAWVMDHFLHFSPHAFYPFTLTEAAHILSPYILKIVPWRMCWKEGVILSISVPWCLIL